MIDFQWVRLELTVAKDKIFLFTTFSINYNAKVTTTHAVHGNNALSCEDHVLFSELNDCF